MNGDLQLYEGLSRAALASVSRPELDPDLQAKAHEDAFLRAIALFYPKNASV
jgi:hypothetical protein